nr:immunoglobulin light chain junction region [Macaca mulatta]MOW06264.1 immunoglobulin light chain junction region [Macaca mulatta]MOW06398.1 immunoglobulin light chain junction region [Macaca mulatta]MOW06922.1 immunoglobulin light chain junction region [Macaca mulatta]MOW06995.1 immunoglobulin light chain junction region [Macaca mulatta]
DYYCATWHSSASVLF